MLKTNIILKSSYFVLLFVIIVAMQFMIPIITKKIINSSLYPTNSDNYDDDDDDTVKSNLSIGPVQLTDIYIFIYYSIIVLLIVLVVINVLLFRKELGTDTLCSHVIEKLYFNPNKIFNSVSIEYLAIASIFLIAMFSIQVYRYIVDALIKTSPDTITNISTYQYGYNSDIYKDDLKKHKYNIDKNKDNLDFLNMPFVSLPIMTILILIFKSYILSGNLVLKNNNAYMLIFVVSLIIYIAIAVKSMVTIFRS